MPNRRNPVIILALNDFIGRHIDELRLRTKGKNERMIRLFADETGHNITAYTLASILRQYMNEHQLDWVPCPNKYYTPKTRSESN
jgi:hypothetical protein